MNSANARIEDVTIVKELLLPLGEFAKYTLSRAPRSSARRAAASAPAVEHQAAAGYHRFMKWSVLDRSPVSEGRGEDRAIRDSLVLAQDCDRLGHSYALLAEAFELHAGCE